MSWRSFVSIAAFLATAWIAAAQAPRQLVVDGKVLGEQVAPRPGEICLLCNEPLHAGDPVYLVQGQRVPVHLGVCDRGLRAESRRWLARLKPRGAFLAAAGEQPALSGFWFFAGLYVLLGLIFAALCAHHALHAGQSPWLWFAAGLVFSALGYLVLLTRPRREVLAPAGVPAGLGKISATYAPEPCPKCASTNHPSATRCLGCGAGLQPRVPSEVARA